MLRRAHQFHDSGQGALVGEAGDFDLQDLALVDGAGEDAMLGADRVRALPGLGRVHHRPLVDRHAFARDGGLVDAALAQHDEAICRHAFIGLDHHDIADDQVVYGYVDQLVTATHQRRLGPPLRQGLDGATGAAHRVVLEGMAETEQEQQQRPLGPLAQDRGARGRHDHQGIDLQLTVAQVLERFAHGEEAAGRIGQQQQDERTGGTVALCSTPGPAGQEEGAGGQGKNDLGAARPRAPAAVIVVVSRASGRGRRGITHRKFLERGYCRRAPSERACLVAFGVLG